MQGSHALRVWGEGDGGHHAQRGFGGGHAFHARQPVGRAHPR